MNMGKREKRRILRSYLCNGCPTWCPGPWRRHIQRTDAYLPVASSLSSSLPSCSWARRALSYAFVLSVLKVPRSLKIYQYISSSFFLSFFLFFLLLLLLLFFIPSWCLPSPPAPDHPILCMRRRPISLLTVACCVSSSIGG